MTRRFAPGAAVSARLGWWRLDPRATHLGFATTNGEGAKTAMAVMGIGR